MQVAPSGESTSSRSASLSSIRIASLVATARVSVASHLITVRSLLTWRTYPMTAGCATIARTTTLQDASLATDAKRLGLALTSKASPFICSFCRTQPSRTNATIKILAMLSERLRPLAPPHLKEAWWRWMKRRGSVTGFARAART